MRADARFAAPTLVAGTLALGHAFLAWPIAAVVALFVGGATLAFVAEAAVVRAGLLVHHRRPRVAGVPVVVPVAWPTVAYVTVGVAALATGGAGTPTVLVAAVLATAFDLVLDPVGVRAGHWSYPPRRLSRPRLRGVPWWNSVGWFVLVAATAAFALAFR